MTNKTLPPRTIVAYNTATESENKIHDDEVANQLGFTGGLVPGVDVYAYACAPAISHWGIQFMDRGRISLRLAAPVFDGETVETIAEIDGNDTLRATVESPTGRCAILEATLAPDTTTAPPSQPQTSGPIPSDRPAASPEVFDALKVMGSYSVTHTEADAVEYLSDIRAESTTSDLGVVHPGWLLRQANYVLSNNVTLGPWIHVGSEITHHRAVRLGETIEIRACVNRHYEHKDHRFVVLDVSMIDQAGTTVCSVVHTAIYEPRQLRQPLADKD